LWQKILSLVFLINHFAMQSKLAIIKGRAMKILRAKVLGFCFGVRDALQLAAQIERPSDVTILGELVHNEQILHQLQLRGFRSVPEDNRNDAPNTPGVLITAHGVSDLRRHELLAAGKNLYDTTCPLVRNVHRAAQRLAAEGRHVILIGKPGHVEVLGIIEDLPHASVFARPDDVVFVGATKLGVISQSTTSPAVALAVRERIAELHPDADIRWIDTICQPTKDRQDAVRELLPHIDALVVVGGAHSNNTRALADLARRHGVPVFTVQSADDLRAEWFGADDAVGLTAGTSTPDDAIDAVAAALERIARSLPERRHHVASPDGP
jgi:4-hydroxy-3-methylbut-2-enyl diphosphate reductase